MIIMGPFQLGVFHDCTVGLPLVGYWRVVHCLLVVRRCPMLSFLSGVGKKLCVLILTGSVVSKQ